MDNIAGSADLASRASASVGGRLDVQQVVEHYTAGKISVVPIVIRNPFDRPITILDVVVPNSTFVRAELRPDRTPGKATNAPPTQPKSSEFGSAFLNAVANIGASFRFAGLELYRITPETDRRTLNINAEAGATVVYDVADQDLGEINIVAEKDSTVQVNPVARKAAEKPHIVLIPPHCEIVETFAFRAGHSMWSQPTTLVTNIQIDYELDGERKTQVVPIAADVRPPQFAIITGSIIGAAAGSIARGMDPTEKKGLLSLVTAVFMAIIASIALSRKSGSQGVITVEDFYGGFLIGALVGYGGSEAFEGMLPKQAAVSGAASGAAVMAAHA
jgi:hypothetical protein